jgi:hypothetical protein
VGRGSVSRAISQKERELFTAQKGFQKLYESEIAMLREDKSKLEAQAAALGTKVEEYRKKAAGYGGLFTQGGKRADAMYALLLENEALEEALHTQNAKLSAERGDAVRESVRAAGYRRVLMSQLLNDDRIKHYVAEILADEKKLPGTRPDASARPQITHNTTGDRAASDRVPADRVSADRVPTDRTPPEDTIDVR